MSGINRRNGYLMIEAAVGTQISSVAIETRALGTTTPVSGSSTDGIIFDHLAFRTTANVPTLGGIGFAALVLVFLIMSATLMTWRVRV